jgi:hypothetical protein
MTWSVPVANQAVRYTLIGTTMLLSITLGAITVGGVASSVLRMKIPDGFTAVSFNTVTGVFFDNSATVASAVVVRTLPNTTVLDIFRFDAANIALSAANSTLFAQIALEVR